MIHQVLLMLETEFLSILEFKATEPILCFSFVSFKSISTLIRKRMPDLKKVGEEGV